MTALPPKWAYYARVQQGANRAQVNSRYWAADEAADVALELLSTPGVSLGELSAGMKNVAVNRTAKHRHRGRILHEQFAPIVQALHVPPVDRQVDALLILERTSASLSQDDWQLLVDVAQGETYAMLAAERDETVGALKMRVSRLRKLLLN